MVGHALRIGIIGAGVMGTKHAEYVAREQDATVVAVADPFSRTLAGKLGVPHFDSYHDLLAASGAEAVIIANPNSAHVETTLAAIQARIPALSRNLSRRPRRRPRTWWRLCATQTQWFSSGITAGTIQRCQKPVTSSQAV